MWANEMVEVRAIIFDASGTLIDDLYPVWQANLKVFKCLGLPYLTLGEFRERSALPWWKFYESQGIQQKRAKNEVNLLFKLYYTKLSEMVRLFPEVKGTLARLKQISIKLGIVSLIPRNYLHQHLRELEIHSYFDIIIASEDCEEPKPSPKSIWICLLGLGVSPSDAVYVGDMEEDIIAGKTAGLKTVAVCREGSYHPREKLEKRNPDFIIDNLSELLEILNKSPRKKQ